MIHTLKVLKQSRHSISPAWTATGPMRKQDISWYSDNGFSLWLLRQHLRVKIGFSKDPNRWTELTYYYQSHCVAAEQDLSVCHCNTAPILDLLQMCVSPSGSGYAYTEQTEPRNTLRRKQSYFIIIFIPLKMTFPAIVCEQIEPRRGVITARLNQHWLSDYMHELMWRYIDCVHLSAAH